MGGADEIARHARDEVGLENRRHHVAVSCSLSAPWRKTSSSREAIAPDLFHDLVVPLAEHAGHDVFGIDAGAGEVEIPSLIGWSSMDRPMTPSISNMSAIPGAIVRLQTLAG
ncbi:MAG: hypothetical protein IPP47_19155 [Bryobacterales bacterium]|nr:hypothetical protein [Bryobacterales bacterium]